MSPWVYTTPTQQPLKVQRPLGLAGLEIRSRGPKPCCLGLARRTWRPLRLLATLAGLAAAPCPARPWPMTIDAISTERQVKDGQIAASGPTEGVRGAHLCRPRAAQQRVPLVCPKCKAAVLIRCEPGLPGLSTGACRCGLLWPSEVERLFHPLGWQVRSSYHCPRSCSWHSRLNEGLIEEVLRRWRVSGGEFCRCLGANISLSLRRRL